MIVYRLIRSKFANGLSGRGAEIAGGRWNSIGVPVVYTAESRALCALEVAVHTQLSVVPEDYLMVSIFIPDKMKIFEVEPAGLPSGWKSFPSRPFTQKLGDKFFREGKFAAVRVPSAVIAGDHNILINPLHKDFALIKILSSEPFEFDKRLFIKSSAIA
jgi:RES domain-containing protein